jgi:hypothetical protein
MEKLYASNLEDEQVRHLKSNARKKIMDRTDSLGRGEKITAK